MQDTFIPALVRPPGTNLLTRSSEQLQSRIRAAENDSSGQKRAELKKVAQEFESLFVSYLLKVMRETIEESGLTEGGLGKDIYTELFDQEMSRSIGRQGSLGISSILMKKLSTETSGHDLTPQPSTAQEPRPVSSDLKVNGEQKDPGKISPSEDPEPEIPDFRLPVQAPVSSYFGLRKDPFTHQIRFHKGLDLAAPEGTDVKAALDGQVTFAGYERGYGNTVVIQHADGLQTKYAHLGSLDVKRGEAIAQDQVLGVVGNTGHSTGPHLHFEVTRWGEQINPAAGLAE